MDVQVFKYIEQLDAFALTDDFRFVLEQLHLGEWGQGTQFIGRYFMLDNDYGEHFGDNWDEREAIEEKAKELGYDSEQLLIVVPERYINQYDGPCHSPKMRKMFWTDVFKSLKLSLDFLFEEARREYQRTMKHYPEEHETPFDIEERISAVLEKFK